MRDIDLILAMQRGERDAVAQLYDRYAALMMGVAMRFLDNRRDAEDLLHDVFLEAWQHAGSYNPKRGNVRQWLLLRLRSRAIDRYRSLALLRRHAASEVDVEPRTCGDSLVRESDSMRIFQALQCMVKEQRRVIELSYFEGLSCSEIATRCAIPIGTVKSRLAAGIGKLRQQLVAEEKC